MSYDDKVLATIAKVICTSLVVMVFLNILHWVDPERNVLTLLGFWTITHWVWKFLNYGDNLAEGNDDE